MEERIIDPNPFSVVYTWTQTWTDTNMYDAGHAILLENTELVRCENIYTRHNKLMLFIQYFSFIFTDRLQNQAYHANVFTVRETHSTLSLPRRAVSCPFRSFTNNQLPLYVFNLFVLFFFFWQFWLPGIRYASTWVRSYSPFRLREGLGVGWACWNTVSLKFDFSARLVVYLAGQKLYFLVRFLLKNTFYTNHWQCLASHVLMYMCSWWFSWTAANSQRARRREMGRGRVQGALGRGIVGTHPLVVWPTMRYFLLAVLERIRWLIRVRFSTKSGVLIWKKDISFLW